MSYVESKKKTIDNYLLNVLLLFIIFLIENKTLWILVDFIIIGGSSV
jgi:hypothetical protein